MKINVYTVDFETPRWLRKAIAYVMPLALVCGAGVAYAKVQHTFQAGEVLKAADLNANFDALALGPIYCGATDSTTGDLSGLTAAGTGYAKARAACQSACMSSTAHMCMGAEVIRSAQHGIAMPKGFPENGVSVHDPIRVRESGRFAFWVRRHMMVPPIPPAPFPPKGGKGESEWISPDG